MERMLYYEKIKIFQNFETQYINDRARFFNENNKKSSWNLSNKGQVLGQEMKGKTAIKVINDDITYCSSC